MKICIDFDSVIVNSAHTVLNLINKRKQLNLKFHEDYGWNFEGLIPRYLLKEAVSCFNDPEFYEEGILVPEYKSLEMIKGFIKDGHEVTIVTNQPTERRINTLKWINTHLPKCQICFTNSFDKSCITGDIFIDDKPDALKSVEVNFNIVICYGDYEWNRNVEDYKIHNLARAEDWIETDIIIKDCEEDVDDFINKIVISNAIREVSEEKKHV